MPMSKTALNSENDMFAQIREGYAFVAAQAKHVRFDAAKIAAYAMRLPLHEPDNTYDETHHFVSDNLEESLAYALIAESVNCGSGYSDALIAEGWDIRDGSIYFSVTGALKNYFDMNGPMTAQQAMTLSEEDSAALCGFDRTKPVQAQVNEIFVTAMNELGAYITHEFDGSFTSFVESGRGSVNNMLRALTALSYYNDMPRYKGRTIPVFKRGQHTIAVLDLVCERHKHHIWDDIERLTMFADNAVPHVLRVDGLLTYSDELADKIARGEMLPAGSEEEVEIRCCAGRLVELIAQQRGQIARDIDFNLWHRSVEDPRYSETPTHKTCTIYY